jgi:hypothetical protein
VSTIGQFGRPPLPLPEGATGIIWEGSHTSTFVVQNGRIIARGFRASLAMHGAAMAERRIGRVLGRGDAGLRIPGSPLSRLNAGHPGSYTVDSLFFPCQSKAVAAYTTDATGARAQRLLAAMAEAGPAMRGTPYHYSTPPEWRWPIDFGPEALKAGFCPPGGRYCINLPLDLHELALGSAPGERRLVVLGDEGVRLDPAAGWPEHAGQPERLAAHARSMKEYVAQSDEAFTALGLRKARIGRTMQGRGLAPVLLGAGTALAGDLYSDATGGNPTYVVDVTMGAVGGGATTAVETFVTRPVFYTGLQRLGVSAASSNVGSRIAGGTSAAVFLAPAITAGTMYFSDKPYTTVDIAAASGRSAASAGGGALAAGLTGAALTVETGPGVVIGFLVGIGGYYVTDYLLGDTVEEAIRVGMGERGCTEGVGPGK